VVPYSLHNEIAVATHNTYILHMNANVWVLFHFILSSGVIFLVVCIFNKKQNVKVVLTNFCCLL
jgi:hypothetical protein